MRSKRRCRLPRNLLDHDDKSPALAAVSMCPGQTAFGAIKKCGGQSAAVDFVDSEASFGFVRKAVSHETIVRGLVLLFPYFPLFHCGAALFRMDQISV
jgi:hypothetical protein